MTDECAALPDLDNKTEFAARWFFEFARAAAIVAIASAGLTTFLDDGEVSQRAAAQPVSRPVAPSPFGSALPLRPAIRDSTQHAESTVPGVADAPQLQSPSSVTTAPQMRRLRKIRAAQDADRIDRHVSKRAAKAKDTPLTVVARTAGVMATDFTRDLRRLPHQISTLFAGRDGARATRERRVR